ncbi:MAG: aminotransferase class I/II-fold pyridoxal phosphate-dependent enzyme, partial [Pseudomonadota bacterium]
RVIVVGSMSKGYAMTGARVGWAIAPTAVINRMVDLAGATTYGLPGFIQDSASFALAECREQEGEVADRYRRRRNVAVAALGNSGFAKPLVPKGGMYVMVDVRASGLDGVSFAEALLDAEHIGVMPGESFGRSAAGYLRIALTVPEDPLADAMARLARFAERMAQAA